MNKDINILAIETSCDETAAAVIRNGREILSNVVSTQIEIHKKFGGVVPEVASRNHIININEVIRDALDRANTTFDEVDVIAATYGPGLVGALLVGLSTAKALSYALDIPFVGVNHIEGHIAANYLAFPELEPPFIALVVSGGHTHIIEVKGYDEYHILGKTKDDAAGEAYDKVARAMELGYPGGPLIDKLAREGRATIDFPKAMMHDGYDFSFSGVKSAVLNHLNSKKMKNETYDKAEVAASFQKAVVDILVQKSIRATIDKGYEALVLCGGVSANSALREVAEQEAKENRIKLYYPPLSLCTDNAAMIGASGYYRYITGGSSDIDLNAKPNLKIGEQ
ncbi:MAG: tRNA (adenosine(37)-N6)-threonylcarbamoyltransferase complex transferase subunit TsaD [Peptostreptococcaceae bacterium]|nr:tRNA (adenosine(37)-N6)-threonylcarbamoyltransferase complex transferase subunit TsaD [Peptostreptococcaceae bacterium]